MTFEFGDTDANILAQMEGGSQADIFHFYTGWQQFYVDQGLVQEIDTSKLANWDAVPVEYQELGQIDGKQYFIPWDWGFTSILYNTERSPRSPAGTRSSTRSTRGTSRCGTTAPAP